MPDLNHPAAAVAVAPGPFAAYVHIPFCAVRCGYCDFNTYAPADRLGLAEDEYLAGLDREIELAGEILAPRPISSVFFGGGTPTLLPAAALVRVLARLEEVFGLAPEAEVTTEANPESLTPEALAVLRAGGFNRLSLGMQSAVPEILATLERQHTPGRVAKVMAWARAAGFNSVNLDLIYGTPGESRSDWLVSVEKAVELDPEHLSAYSLIVEPGTRMARRVAVGELTEADSDELADKYLAADDRFQTAGLRTYEVSNWAKPGHECRHNLAYWHSQDWWGFGAGAHSHLAGRRWWNRKHPRAYLTDPVSGFEELTAEQRQVEVVMLRVRLAEGIELFQLPDPSRAREVVTRGWGQIIGERLVLNRDGRLMADAIARLLLYGG